MSEHWATNQGEPAEGNLNSQAAGQSGPAVMEYSLQNGRLPHLSQEHVRASAVLARSAGARGIFITEHSMSAYTTACFVQKEGQQTPVFARFSSTVHGQGSPETVRGPRGFAVKFYTEEGSYDMVGSHLPVLPGRREMDWPGPNDQAVSRYWDFMTQSPKPTHMLTWLFANDGIPANYRQMNGYSVHACKWINAEGKQVYVKYHWRTKQGVANFTPSEAANMQASDFSHATRDLYASIELGSFPQWELLVQLMTPEAAEALLFDPLDPTKTWPEERFPLNKVGTMTLNQNPVSYFTEVERTVFSRDTLVPGIEPFELEDHSMNGFAVTGSGSTAKTDDFMQAGERYRALPEEDCGWLVHNLVHELRQVPQPTQLRAVCNFFRADAGFGSRLADGLGLDLGEYMPRG